MVGRLIAIAALLVLAACGSDGGVAPPDPVNVEATWAGTFQADSQDVSLTLDLKESNGTVTGDGSLVTSAGTFPLTVNGTYDSPRLAIAITTPGFDVVSLVAIVGEDTMTGTIGGGGFENETFTLERQ